MSGNKGGIKGTDNNFVSTTKVGTKLPNAFGIYDMAGNVWERCSDYWNHPYQPKTGTDPQGPETGFARTHRGGAWDSYCRTCNATSRRHPFFLRHVS